MVHSGSRLWWIAKRNFMTWTQATSYITQCGILMNFLSTVFFTTSWDYVFSLNVAFWRIFCRLFSAIPLCILLFFAVVNQKSKLRCFVAESREITIEWNNFWSKVHIFWEGHKILRNLPLTFDHSTYSQELGEDFAKFCGLLWIYEL